MRPKNRIVSVCSSFSRKVNGRSKCAYASRTGLLLVWMWIPVTAAASVPFSFTLKLKVRNIVKLLSPTTKVVKWNHREKLKHLEKKNMSKYYQHSSQSMLRNKYKIFVFNFFDKLWNYVRKYVSKYINCNY